MEQYYPLFKGDPFLESSYWEKQAQNAFLCRRFADMVQPLLNAIRLGVPEAHLYNRLGVACLATGDFNQADWALKHAMAFKDNQTSAAYLYAHFGKPRRILNVP
jgi:Flp pilus assembly protein TadD